MNPVRRVTRLPRGVELGVRQITALAFGGTRLVQPLRSHVRLVTGLRVDAALCEFLCRRRGRLGLARRLLRRGGGLIALSIALHFLVVATARLDDVRLLRLHVEPFGREDFRAIRVDDVALGVLFLVDVAGVRSVADDQQGRHERQNRLHSRGLHGL